MEDARSYSTKMAHDPRRFHWIMIACVLALVCHGNSGVDDEDVVPIHIGGICTISNHWWIHARVFPAILQSAFDDINNSSGMLPGYRLVLDMMDDQGQPGLAMKALFHYLNTFPPRIMLLGPTKSEATNAVSLVAPVWNLLSVLYSARSSDITNRGKYKNTYVVNPLDKSLNPVRLAIMSQFGWTKIATITQSEEAFFTQMETFQEALQEMNYTVVTSSVLSENSNEYIAEHLKRLKQFDARIIVANINDMYVRQLFCEAYHIGLTGIHYQWIIMNWSVSPGWPENLDPNWAAMPIEPRCTIEELYLAAEGYIGLGQKYLSDSPRNTVSGMTPAEIVARSNHFFLPMLPSEEELPHNHPHAYDAAWAIALSLNASIAPLADVGKRLEDFAYNDSQMTEIFRQSFDNLNFRGASGPVSFRKDGSRIGITYITYWRDRYMYDVGLYNEAQHNLTWYDSHYMIPWTGGAPPNDYIRRRIVKSMLPSGLQWALMSLSFAGCGLAIALLVFNVYYRKERAIKMSSPRLNNLILLGAMLMYVVVICKSMDQKYIDVKNYWIVCQVGMWLSSVAFTMAFGAMFTKIWRVYRIFTNAKHEKRIIKDWRLFMLVALLMMCDVIVLSLWTALDPIVSKEIVLPEVIDHHDVDTVIVYRLAICESENSIWFQVTLILYKGFLLILGSFLAWETRTVTIPELNDSKTIGFCIYNVTILCAFSVPLSFVLDSDEYVVAYGLISCLILFCTTSSLLLLFYSKVKQKTSGKVDVTLGPQSENPGMTTLNTEFTNTNPVSQNAHGATSDQVLIMNNLTK